MRRLSLSTLGFLAFTTLAPGCSLEAPSKGRGLNIHLEKKAEAALYQLLFLPRIASTPSSVSDFNCFGVNVTGQGIEGNLEDLDGCTIHDNMKGRGVGIISEELVTRGAAIHMEVPAGPNRNIDVYGIYPPAFDCDPNADDSAKQDVYFLGGVIQSLGADGAEVTVPIGFATGASPSLTCESDGNELLATIDGTSNFGFSNGSTCVDSSISNSTPPSGYASTSFSGAETTGVSSQNSSTTNHQCATGTTTAAVQEYSFAIDPNTAAQYYSQITVTWAGAAGSYTGSCASGPIATDSGTKLEVYNHSTTSWESVGSPLKTPQTITKTFSPIKDYIHSNAIRVRVLGEAPGTSNCSRIETDYVAVKFD